MDQIKYFSQISHPKQTTKLKTKNVCKFDPLNGDYAFITKKEHQEIKTRRSRLQKKVIMCSQCRSIVHTSSYPVHKLDQKYYERAVQDVLALKNHRTIVQSNEVFFRCNNCPQKVGHFDEKLKHIHTNMQNSGVFVIKLVEDGFKLKKKQDYQKYSNLGCYNGVKINFLKKLLAKIMYSKLIRYRTNLKFIKNETSRYLTALRNFIKVMNAFESQGESATRRLTIQDLKNSSFSSLVTCNRSKDELKVFKEQTISKSQRKKEGDSSKIDFKEQEMKNFSLSTTAFQQNTSQNIRNPAKKLLLPIREAKQ